MPCIVQTPEKYRPARHENHDTENYKREQEEKPKSPTPLLPAVATPMNAAMMHIAIMLRKQNKIHHQYSERVARPVKVAYLLKQVLMACANVMI